MLVLSQVVTCYLSSASVAPPNPRTCWHINSHYGPNNCMHSSAPRNPVHIKQDMNPAAGREERVTSPEGWTGCRGYAAIGTVITPCAVYHVPVIWWLPLHNSIKQ